MILGRTNHGSVICELRNKITVAAKRPPVTLSNLVSCPERLLGRVIGVSGLQQGTWQSFSGHSCGQDREKGMG